MNATQTQLPTDRPSRPPRSLLDSLAGADATSLFARPTAEGHFSIVDFGTLTIEAEPGLVIRVHAGCVWVPRHREHCSVDVAPGEQFVVAVAGPFTVLVIARTHVELVWPPRQAARRGET